MTNWRPLDICRKTRGGGVPLGILSLNPDPISDQKRSFSTPVFTAGTCFSKVSAQLFEPEKLLCVCRVYIQGQSFNNFESNKMKLQTSIS